MWVFKAKICTAVLACLVCILPAGPVFAIVLHNDDEPTNTPNPGVLGSWYNDASCVVVAPNYIVTTRHQGGAGTVTIGGLTYNVTQDIPHSTADLRVARIIKPGGEHANLANWAELYTMQMGSEIGEEIVLGGFGKSRGVALETEGTTYGYSWTTEGSVGTQLRWGTNEIHNTGTRADNQGRTSQVVIADFDDPDAPQGHPSQYEAAPAEFDSGGGWFIPDGDLWYLAGLSRGAEHALLDQTWFRNNVDPDDLDPDSLDAVRISSYANWIYDQIRHDGDANGDLVVDIVDLTVVAANWFVTDPLNWYDGDFTGDGDIDIADLTALAAKWGPVSLGSGSAPPLGPPDDGTVPEPAALLLLGIGGCAMLKRRGRQEHESSH